AARKGQGQGRQEIRAPEGCRQAGAEECEGQTRGHQARGFRACRRVAGGKRKGLGMGQKVNPIGFRLPITRDWSSKWYASRKDFADYLLADGKIRGFLHRKLRQAPVSRIVIERAWNSLRVTIHTARPGVVIGRKGSEIEKMTDEISRLAGGKQVKIDIIEIKAPDIEAQLVAENVASQLERRISFRRAMKRAVQLATEQGALGIKIRCSGRLGGAEIARTEWYREGKIPLH